MSDSEIRMGRVEEDSPFRCQGVTAHGQCYIRQVPGSKFCPAHGGTNALRAQEKEKQRLYLLTQFQDRVHAHEDHSEIKSLRSEIAILRMLLETTLNKCKDEYELMLKSSHIGQLVNSLNALVMNCNKLELSTGGMLDGNQAISWVQQIARIIDTHVKDTEIVNAIVNEMMIAYEETRNGVGD